MKTIRYTALLSLGIAFCIGCGDSSTQPWEGKSQAHGQKNKATVEGSADNDQETEAVQFDVPKSWIRKAPNPMLIADFAIPRAEGDNADARLTVSQANGTLEDNINRWKGQFSKLEKKNQETIDVDGIKVTLVDFSGTFEDSRGPMTGPKVSCPDYRLLGGVFEADGHLNFIKCYGPEKTIAARSGEVNGFIKSMPSEVGKTQGQKNKPGPEGIANNDGPNASDESSSPPMAINPHGDNPHAGIQIQASGAGEVLENDGKLDVDTGHWTVPKSWVRKAPNPMLKAEFAIPKADGDKRDARLTVSQANGTLEDNLNRWKGQFSKLDNETQTTIDVGGIKVTLVDFSGTFEDSRGPMMGPKVSCPDYRLLGGVFQLPGEDALHFIKCYGPKKTILARADEINGFIKSLKEGKGR